MWVGGCGWPVGRPALACPGAAIGTAGVWAPPPPPSSPASLGGRVCGGGACRHCPSTSRHQRWTYAAPPGAAAPLTLVFMLAGLVGWSQRPPTNGRLPALAPPTLGHADVTLAGLLAAASIYGRLVHLGRCGARGTLPLHFTMVVVALHHPVTQVSSLLTLVRAHVILQLSHPSFPHSTTHSTHSLTSTSRSLSTLPPSPPPFPFLYPPFPNPYLSPSLFSPSLFPPLHIHSLHHHLFSTLNSRVPRGSASPWGGLPVLVAAAGGPASAPDPALVPDDCRTWPFTIYPQLP